MRGGDRPGGERGETSLRVRGGDWPGVREERPAWG